MSDGYGAFFLETWSFCATFVDRNVSSARMSHTAGGDLGTAKQSNRWFFLGETNSRRQAPQTAARSRNGQEVRGRPKSPLSGCQNANFLGSENKAVNCGKCLRNCRDRTGIVEAIGLISAVLGIVAAVLNRRRIVIHRYESTSYSSTTSPRTGISKSPTRISKRFKRLVICLGLAFVCACAGASSQESNGALSNFMFFPFCICLLLGAYQVAAIVIMVFARLWR